MFQKQDTEILKSPVPPKLNATEKERFRQIDAEAASGRRRVNSVDDVHWVYDRLDEEDVTAMDAPSRGAWTRLFQARFNRVNFFTSTWPNALKEILKRKIPTTSKAIIGTSDMSHEKVTAMIISALEESKSMEI